MRKILLLFLSGILWSGATYAQTTVVEQDFDSATSWGYTPDVSFFDNTWGGDGFYGIIDVSSASPLNSSSFSGNIIGVTDLDDEGDNGTTGFAKITFDFVDVSGLTNVEVNFDYQLDGFDSSDEVLYAVYEASGGTISLKDSAQVEAGGTGDGTISVSMSAGIDSLQTIIYIKQNGATDYAGFDNFKVTQSALKAEPSNHPTSFTATADGFSEIDLTWTDATGSVIPDGYLIKLSDTSLGSITDPTDGTEETDDTDAGDGAAVLNISAGVESATFSGLNDDTQYFFKIYSYTNSGSSIDFKTDGTIESDDATTDPFDSDIVISQYVESGSIKGIEIWNVSGSTIDFSTSSLVVRRYSNGSTSSSTEATISTGSLADGDVIVIGSDSLSAYMTAYLPSVTFLDDGFSYNGDDALDITLGGTLQDVFGTIGSDPGSEWAGNGVSTEDQNIELQVGITEGTATGFTDPSTRFQSVDNSISTTGDLRGFGLAPGDLLITGNAGWRLISIPKSGATGADISDDGIGAQFTTNTDSATIYTYDNSGTFEPVSSDATTLTDGLGLAVYFFDNTVNGSTELPLVLDVTGSEPGSDVAVSINGGSSGLFTLVGNPFATNYNTNSISETSGSISDNISLWNDATGSYTTADRTSDYIIAPWQGFWIETADASVAEVSFNTSGKTTSSASGAFFSKEVESRKGDIAFSLSSDNSYDEAIKLAFREYATLGFDRADASKLTPMISEYATLAFKSDDILKSVESLPFDLNEEVTISFEEQIVGLSGEFVLEWTGLTTIPSDWNLILHDYESGENIDMRSQESYTFEEQSSSKLPVAPRSLLSGMQIQRMKTTGTNRFGITITPSASTVSNEPGTHPEVFTLEQNYPNPFNPTTTISYSVNTTGPVSLEVYNLMGQKVAQLVNETKNAGSYNVNWDASQMASGIYIYRLNMAGQTLTRKMTLIK